jgi:hypothetical protein
MRFLSWLRHLTRYIEHARTGRARRFTSHSALLQVERLEHRWCPSFSLVTSRTALAGTDSVNWGTLGPNGIHVANPFTILSSAGRSISVSKTISDSFKEGVQCPSPTGCSWGGNFAPGDSVLSTYDIGSKLNNPITLNFGSTAVAAGGAQIQTDFQGRFTAQVEAFDTTGKSLATFTEKGISTSAADNSAIFIGIISSSANIFQIALSIKVGEAQGDFAINNFDFRTSALAPLASVAVPAVRQPASPVDLASLASSLLEVGWPAMPVAPIPGPAAFPAPPASQSSPPPVVGISTHGAAGASSAAPVRATDAVFAVSSTAVNDEGYVLLAPLLFSNLDAI